MRVGCGPAPGIGRPRRELISESLIARLGGRHPLVGVGHRTKIANPRRAADVKKTAGWHPIGRASDVVVEHDTQVLVGPVEIGRRVQFRCRCHLALVNFQQTVRTTNIDRIVLPMPG